MADGIIKLDSNCTIGSIDPTRTRLLDLLVRCGSVTVDCAAITEADLTLVQMLLAARKSAAGSSKRLVIAGARDGALWSVLNEGAFLHCDDGFWLGETD